MKYKRGIGMKIERRIKEAFVVIGKEGSSQDGPGFIQKLWADANGHFHEVEALAKKAEIGCLVGVWGAMSDYSRSFQPWEDHFSKGLYLAGVECDDQAQPPAGWTKWTVPGYEYLCALCENENTFSRMLAYMAENNLTLAGAVHDFTCPATGKNYMYFPIRKL